MLEYIEEKEKSPALGGIWTHHLLISRTLYSCATTAAQQSLNLVFYL